MPDEQQQASPGYAFGQLERALRMAAEHDDPATRQRARAKAERWRAVLAGMADGRLTVGSRTPVAGTPAWVTLEVAHGGFATGRLLAEAPLSDDEAARVAALPADAPGETERERLNLWYLGDAGQAELLAALASEQYRIELPEDAALPTVAWLLRRGEYEEALDLVAELRPWMDRLRFSPRLEPITRPAGASVHLEPVGAVRKALRGRTVPAQIAVMHETLRVWHPLYDRLVALWCDTVDGDLPTVIADGLTGGWPCRRWPDDWASRRVQWLADYAAADREHRLATEHRQPKSNLARLRTAIERCPADGSLLTGREVGSIRRALANTVTAHGAPGSERRAALRTVQAAVAVRPTHAAIAQVLADRLEPFPADGGLPSVDAVAYDLTADEARAVGPDSAGQPVPRRLSGKLERALEAPVDVLVERGIIGSGEVLATVLPQVTSQLLAANLDDPELRQLCTQAYAAFRRRRGLLLLDLEHQVGFEELPWVGAVAPQRAAHAESAQGARQALRQTTLLALTAFPQTILPNPLVREFGALATQARLRLPLVEEVAADIFMGTFSRKWHDAATIASTVLAGSLYARYYDLPEAAYWAAHEPPPEPPAGAPREPRAAPVTADAFAALCASRAAAEAQAGGGGAPYVAVNGTVIEQSQILTTHNLAPLLHELELADRLRPAAPELTGQIFQWLVRRLAQPTPSRHAALIAVKNAAYAWRQAIFFASLADADQQRAAVDTLRAVVDEAGLTRFRPAVDGLAHVVDGGRFEPNGTVRGADGRRLLGWNAGTHWYLAG